MKAHLTDCASVVIVGGGFSGTLLAFHLATLLPDHSPHRIVILEKTGHFGDGVAYSTHDPNHLLNVRADRMGAFPDEPGHFFNWLKVHEQKWKKLFPSPALSSEAFVPRQLYGLYLQDIVEQTKQLASKKKLILTYISDKAIDVSEADLGKVKVIFFQGKSIIADILILATNVPVQKRFEVTQDLSKAPYFENIWTPSKDNPLFQSSLSHLPSNMRIVIIGSGLTMIDATLSLIEKKYPGDILAISKHGELPRPHLECSEKTSFEFKMTDLPKTTSALFRYVRRQIALAEKHGIAWQTVIDALRVHTNPFWESLEITEKKRFLRHVLCHWNKYRHRISPSAYKKIQAHLKAGKLQMKSGNVHMIIKTVNNPKAFVATSSEMIEADYILNCSGAQLNLCNSQDPLIKNLLEKKLIFTHSSGTGLQVKENYQVINDRPVTIFAMGQLLFGQKLETVAIPELREQCARIAKEVCNQLHKQQRYP